MTAPGHPTHVGSPWRIAVERGGKATDAPLDVEAVARDREPNRETIARNDERLLFRLPRQLSSFRPLGRYNLRVLE